MVSCLNEPIPMAFDCSPELGPDVNVCIPMTYLYSNAEWPTVKFVHLLLGRNFLDGDNFIKINEKASYINELLRTFCVVKGSLNRLDLSFWGMHMPHI